MDRRRCVGNLPPLCTSELGSHAIRVQDQSLHLLSQELAHQQARKLTAVLSCIGIAAVRASLRTCAERLTAVGKRRPVARQSAQAIASRTVARLVPFVTVSPAMATSTQILPTHCWNFFNSCKSASPRPRQWTVCDFWCICTGAASTKHAGDSDVSVASARLPVGLRRVRL